MENILLKKSLPRVLLLEKLFIFVCIALLSTFPTILCGLAIQGGKHQNEGTYSQFRSIKVFNILLLEYNLDVYDLVRFKEKEVLMGEIETFFRQGVEEEDVRIPLLVESKEEDYAIQDGIVKLYTDINGRNLDISSLGHNLTKFFEYFATVSSNKQELPTNALHRTSNVLKYIFLAITTVAILLTSLFTFKMNQYEKRWMQIMMHIKVKPA